MGRIRVLSDDLASQVAAGEVVERPASLVKELVENSLDARASRIWISYVQGGSRLVCVRDDGCGMDRDDAVLCFERHATSKIRNLQDLAGVRSMGFRGEALPSIASVARLRLTTRESSAAAATEVRIAAGRIQGVGEIGAPAGTQVEVRDLFFNVPARRKFLRSEETESAHIIQGLSAIALAHPTVGLECRRDGKLIFELPRADSLAVRIRDLFGAEHLGRLIEIEPVEGGQFRIAGFVSAPGNGRRDRLHQIVIVNGRPIQCSVVQLALREAFADAITRGEHPLCVLVVEMDTDLVDCNVHPAKREVRLRQPDPLKRAVFDAARRAIARARQPRPTMPAFAVSPPVPFAPAIPQQAIRFDPPPADPFEAKVGSEPADQRFRLLAIVAKGYLVLEGEEGLVLLDTRAARERILFESLMREMETGDAASQRLLIPLVVELPPREHAWIAEHFEELRAAGFSLERFGGSTLKVEAIPAAAAGTGPEKLLHELASGLRAAGRLPLGKGFREAVARSVSRLAAGDHVQGDGTRAKRLVADLLRCELPYASPSGRPTMIQFSFAELDRRFGRSR